MHWLTLTALHALWPLGPIIIPHQRITFLFLWTCALSDRRSGWGRARGTGDGRVSLIGVVVYSSSSRLFKSFDFLSLPLPFVRPMLSRVAGPSGPPVWLSSLQENTSQTQAALELFPSFARMRTCDAASVGARLYCFAKGIRCRTKWGGEDALSKIRRHVPPLCSSSTMDQGLPCWHQKRRAPRAATA